MQFESLLPHLKDLKTGHDYAKVLAQDVRAALERNARLSAKLRSEFGQHLAVLAEGPSLATEESATDCAQ